MKPAPPRLQTTDQKQISDILESIKPDHLIPPRPLDLPDLLPMSELSSTTRLLAMGSLKPQNPKPDTLPNFD